MALGLGPPVVKVAPNGRANFVASGGTPPYVYSILTNRSGGSIDAATGAYLAGPHGLVTDTVHVIDNASVTANASAIVAVGLWQRVQQLIGPPSTKLPNIQIVEGDVGAEKDILFERSRQGLLSNMPGYGPADALDISGAPIEADATYAERLRTQWDSIHGWSPAGAHAPLLRALDRAGFPMGDPDGAHVVQSYKRISWLASSGGAAVYGTHADPWMFEAIPFRFWNQFGIIFGADVPELSDGSPAAQRLNAIVDKWRPRKARFMGTWVVVSGPTWDFPIGVAWDDGGRVWGGGSTRFVQP
jgi:hypothetical protein